MMKNSNTKIYDNVYNFIFFFIKEQKYKFALILILGLAVALQVISWPYFISQLIDNLNTYHDRKLDIWQILWSHNIMYGIILLIIIECVSRLQGIVMMYTLPKFEASLRMEMFRYASRHSFNYFL